MTVGNARIVSRCFAVAVGRFCPDGVLGYRASTMPSPPLRAAREEAMADELAWLERVQEVSA